MTPAPGTASPAGGFLSAHIALVGRPNSGKSSLLNAVMQEEVSIVTPLPQTTRANLRGIYTDKRMQLVFVDTPGMHRGKHAYNEAMTRESESVVHADEVDIVCYVVDLAREFGPEEDHVAELVRKSGAPVMVVLNKADVCADTKSATVKFFKRYPALAASPRIEISAIGKGAGKKFLAALSPRIKPGPMFYPEEDLTDQNLRFFAAEFLRKHIIGCTREEVPHAAFVEITDYKETPTVHKVEATIHVESMGQRGIIIGPKGSLITRIQKEAERDLGRLAQTRVSIKCHVKVSERWRDNHSFLRSMGYEDSTKKTPRRNSSKRRARPE